MFHNTGCFITNLMENSVNSASNQNKHPTKQQLANWKKNMTSTSRLGRVGLAIRCHPPTKLCVVRPSNSSTPQRGMNGKGITTSIFLVTGVFLKIVTFYVF